MYVYSRRRGGVLPRGTSREVNVLSNKTENGNIFIQCQKKKRRKAEKSNARIPLTGTSESKYHQPPPHTPILSKNSSPRLDRINQKLHTTKHRASYPLRQPTLTRTNSLVHPLYPTCMPKIKQERVCVQRKSAFVIKFQRTPSPPPQSTTK